MLTPHRKYFLSLLISISVVYVAGYLLLEFIIPDKINLPDLYSFETIFSVVTLSLILAYTSDADSTDPDSYKKRQDRTITTSVTLDELHKEIQMPWTSNLGYKIGKTDSEITIDNKLDTMSITSEEKGILRIKSRQKRMIPLSDLGRNFKNYERVKSILVGMENS